MVIWTGWGLLVLVFVVIGAGTGELLANLAQTDQNWPMGIGTLLAAGMNYSAAKMLESEGEILIDPETGEEVLLKSSHSLFFIPIKYWTYVFGALAVLWFLLTLELPFK